MNYLTELKVEKNKSPHKYSLYRCKCGTEKVIRKSHVTKGKIVSCGCYKKKIHTTHGMHKTSIYSVWQEMKSRCNLSNRAHKHYADRGISVCKRWEKFENFYADMGDSNGLELDRKDNNKGYSKENCRWTTRTVQMRNTNIRPHSSKYRGVGLDKRNNKWRANITIAGKLIHIGTYKTENEAGLAWNEVAKTYKGFNLNKIE